MANKNKKLESLVDPQKAALATDFDVIPTLTQRVNVPVAELEVDDDTFDIERSNAGIDASSKSEMAKALKDQSRKIEELEFELEHAQVRRRGLAKELEVREEITQNITSELRAAKQQIRNAVSESVLAELNDQLKNRQGQIESLSRDLDASHEENLQLRETLQRDVDAEIDLVQHKIAEQEGELAARAQEIDRLKKDNTRFEEYSNSLRIQLQDQISAGRILTTMRRQMESSLDDARCEIGDLRQQVQDEQDKNLKLSKVADDLKKEFDREIRQVRFELTSAQETLADQEGVNEQLASDLIDNRGFRLALESHVGEIEVENRERIKELTRKLKIARQEAEEQEDNLRAKDAAIADLMKELSSRSRGVQLSDDVDNVLKKIDGFRPEDSRSTKPVTRDKTACLLIDNADGRELRFPLFKDRLTIGRTSHNDIQLDLRFVSRRHAVISNDCGKTRVIDWGSKNGVYVNKKRVAEKILSPGDIVTIGMTEMRYEERPKR